MARRDVIQTLRDAESEALRELHAIRAAISAMAGSPTGGGGRKRRGRPRKRASGAATGTARKKRKTRGWTAAQRKAAAERMSAYWVRKKAGRGK
jgi:hypothetical protein